MKRGFMDRNGELLPADLLRKRQEVFISGFKEYDLEAAVIYGDVASADELQYLTNLGPYWSNATAIIDKNGNVKFVTGLSARVDPWVAMISGVDQSDVLAAGPNLNTKVAAVLKEQLGGRGKIGITGVYFPQEMADALEAAGFTPVFYQQTIAEQLKVRDEAYRKTLTRGIELMNAAVATVLKNPEIGKMSRKNITADVEYACRSAGAMDILILNGDKFLNFGKAEDVAEGSDPWTLYIQLQYLGEWFVIARNMKAECSSEAKLVRDRVIRKLKPGARPLTWTEKDYKFALCDQVRSDHVCYWNEGETEIDAGQILSLRVINKEKGIYIEDMVRITSDGAVLLTDI